MFGKWGPKIADALESFIRYGVPLIIALTTVILAKKFTRSAGIGYWWCIPRLFPHRMEIPDMSESQYYHKTGPRNTYNIGFFPTIDDPLLIQLADTFQKQYGHLPKNSQARILLAFVQQNVKYTSDEKIYPKEYDAWQFPATTIRDARGDCEDSAFLFAGIAYLIGLDVIMVGQPGHMTCGYAAEGWNIGASVFFNGKTYWIMETTSVLNWQGMGPSGSNRLENIKLIDDIFRSQIRDMIPVIP